MKARMCKRLVGNDEWGNETGLERQVRAVSCTGLQAMLRSLTFILNAMGTYLQVLSRRVM